MSAASACSNDTSEITGKLVKINSTVTQTGFGEGPVHTAKNRESTEKLFIQKRKGNHTDQKKNEKDRASADRR